MEGNHGKLKRLIRPTLGFQSMKTAYATIKSFEVMRMFKKGYRRVLRLAQTDETCSRLMTVPGAGALELIADVVHFSKHQTLSQCVSKTFLFDTNLSRLTIGDQCVLFESYAELKA